MKKLSLLVIVLFFSSLSLYSQKVRDALYLRNGSIIHGQLIEISNDSYKLRTSDGSLMIYPASEVEKFAKSMSYFEGRKAQGFTFALEGGVMMGSQESQYFAPFSFNVLAGMTSNTRHITSIGSGVEFIGRPYTPFFIEYKYLVRSNKVSPFILLRGGAIVPLNSDGSSSSSPGYYDYQPMDHKGGLSAAFGTGISWARPDYETYLSFAYRYAHVSYTQNEGSRGLVTYEDSMNRLEVKFGFKF